MSVCIINRVYVGLWLSKSPGAHLACQRTTSRVLLSVCSVSASWRSELSKDIPGGIC